jgi:dTDP-4-dehydrorhamnose 3,5-epimerase
MDIVAVEELPAVRVITPQPHQDARGVFAEVWRADAMKNAGIAVDFVQDNHAFSRAVGTIRGLHFQIGASAQAKLVRCIRGSVLDVAVDIRSGSPSYGRHAAIILSAENWKQLFVPGGFAHGYCTLEPDTEVLYKVSAYYDPACERGLAWDDPTLAIAWPAGRPVLAEKDRNYPQLADLPDFFPFDKFPD